MRLRAERCAVALCMKRIPTETKAMMADRNPAAAN
jgi:hypothetical protein